MQIDPNTVVAVAGLLGGLWSWLWHKGKGDPVPSLRSILQSVIEPEIEYALDRGLSLSSSRTMIESAAWRALERARVPKNRTTRLLVHEAIESAVSELRRRIRARENERAAKALPAKLGELEDAITGVAKAFIPPPEDERTVPALPINVEIVK